MFDMRTIITLAVSFLTDFFGTLVTGLGGGVIATNTVATVTGTPEVITVLPGLAVWVFAIMGALVAALRGLQKNLSEPVASPTMMRARRATQAVDRAVDRSVAAADAAPVPAAPSYTESLPLLATPKAPDYPPISDEGMDAVRRLQPDPAPAPVHDPHWHNG